MPPTTPASLFPHQREAVDAARKTLAQSSRATAVMPCGTGKTRVGAEVAHHLEAAGEGHRLGRFLQIIGSLVDVCR
ncbi:DEAD/DEAH box helicase family protein [Streptomyces sp. NPDC045470]|uniref:DEAD/DEAH box helicase family protein n=1 Tax=Streptomyces sp. NPDC045470 TaxID=3155469 RepID=UPI0034058C6A